MKPGGAPRDAFVASTKIVKKWANDKQAWLYQRGPYPTLLVGGQNSGKTVGCVLKALTLLQTYPGSRIAVIRRSNIQLEKTTMESWFQWCVSPDTLILTEDLRYVPAGTVRPGDRLQAFDEQPADGKHRWHRIAVVESVTHLRRPGRRLTMSDGSVLVCSAEHQWLVRNGNAICWRRTDGLWERGGTRPPGRTGKTPSIPGDEILKPFSVWQEDTTREGGYLAGVYDGEGSVFTGGSRSGSAFRVSFAQNPGVVLDRVLAALRVRGFTPSVTTIPGRREVRLGIERRSEAARLLGSIRPSRLLPKAHVTGRLYNTNAVFVDKNEAIGEIEVVAIKTSTGTFIAEGFASHNCTAPFYRPYGGFNKNSGVLDFNNGSRVYFLHLDQPDSLDVLAGLELNFAYVSQVEEISEKAWDLLDVRVGRWTGATIPEEIIAAYPGGREAWPWRPQDDPTILVPPRYIFAEGYVTDETHWLFQRFADESPFREKWKAQGYACKIVESAENQFAIKAVTDSLYAKDEDYLRRYVRPRWGNPEGAIFNVSPLSLLQPTPALLDRIRSAMRWHRALDHGDSAPTCCVWYAVDSDNNIFVVREHYKENLLVTQHRKAIFELGKNDPPYQTNYADPSIFGKSRGRSADRAPEWSIADEWRDQRIGDPRTAISWLRSQNDEATTVSRMKEFLFVDPNHRHPITGEPGAPHIYFIVATPEYPNGCYEVLKDIRAQRRKSVAIVGDVKVFSDDRDDTVRDHGFDALKYGLVMRPSPASPGGPPPTPPGQIAISTYMEAGRETRLRRARAARAAGTGIKYGF